MRDAATLSRIRALAIPPAWTDVWIAPDPRGHIQATGRDARGRKQYRYHARWREVRDAAKYHRLVEFCASLPGHTVAVCRASYVHPGVLEDFASDRLAVLAHQVQRRIGKPRSRGSSTSVAIDAMRAIEPIVARYLRRRPAMAKRRA